MQVICRVPLFKHCTDFIPIMASRLVTSAPHCPNLLHIIKLWHLWINTMSWCRTGCSLSVLPLTILALLFLHLWTRCVLAAWGHTSCYHTWTAVCWAEADESAGCVFGCFHGDLNGRRQRLALQLWDDMVFVCLLHTGDVQQPAIQSEMPLRPWVVLIREVGFAVPPGVCGKAFTVAV